MFRRANLFYEQGNTDQAERLYREILLAIPGQPDVLNMLGLIALKKRLPEEACSYFYQALAATPDKIALRFNLAAALTDAGHLPEAQNAYLKVLNLDNSIKEAHNNLGGIFERLGQTDLARQAYLQALAIAPSYLEAAVNLAALEQDRATLEKLARENPTSPLALFYLGQLCFNQKDYTAAAAYLDAALKIEKNSDEINLLQAQTMMALQDFQAAETYFEQVLQQNPKSVCALAGLGRLKQDESFFKQALSLDPDNLEARANYANLLYTQNRRLEALEEYRKAVVLNPSLPELSNNLAMLLKDMGEYEQAVDLLLNAFVNAPQNRDFSVNLAETLTLLEQKSPQTALSVAQKWAEAAPDNPFATHVLASFTGAKDQNQENYSEALFDTFAENYDSVMEKIKYNVLNEVKNIGIDFNGKILDLGCGTGAAAAMFKTADNQFDGVDISQKMLDKAALKNVYHRLVKSDLLSYLEQNNVKYNLIIALDVLEYIENIEAVFKAAFESPLLFTIESNTDTDDKFLMPNGRYQHNPKYITELLQNARYQKIQTFKINLRRENNQDVPGVIFYAQK